VNDARLQAAPWTPGEVGRYVVKLRTEGGDIQPIGGMELRIDHPDADTVAMATETIIEPAGFREEARVLADRDGLRPRSTHIRQSREGQELELARPAGGPA